MKAVNIMWDTDGKKDIDLPTEVEIPEEILKEDYIADYLSDTYGFCVHGFNITNDKMNERFINTPDNIKRYEALVKQVIEDNTQNMSIEISSLSYDDYIRADCILAWYNKYCEDSEKYGCSFEAFVSEQCHDLFLDTIFYEEEDLLKKVEQTIISEHPDLYPIFTNKTSELYEGLPSYEVLAEGGYEGATVDYESFFRKDYHINLMFATPKEENYDMGAIPTMFYESADKSADFDYFTDNALTYLIHQQGYTLADVYEGIVHPEKVAENTFLKSVVEEIDNFPNYSMAELTALISLSGKDLLDTLDAIANGREYIVLSKGTMIGLYNEWQGTGSMLEIQLERDAIIPTSMVRNVQFEGERGGKVKENNGYTVDECFGLIGSCWTEGEVSLTAEAPLLREEDMKKTQTALRALNKQAAKEKVERDD